MEIVSITVTKTEIGMNKQVKLLELNEVVTVENYYQIVILHSTFRVSELTEALMQDLSSFGTAYYECKQKECLKKVWFEEGIDCEILKLGAKDWQKGKIKIRVSLEFCPNEPDVEETIGSNQSEFNKPESPLDDIRQMMNENT